MTGSIPQATSRAAILMPALVESAFDYLVPEATPEGALVEATLASRALVGVVWGAAAVADKAPAPKKMFTLKPISRVLTGIPPLRPEFRAWIDWVSDFTLAPKGAVLSLCGLAHAAKTTRKHYVPPVFTCNLPTLTAGQQAVVEALREAMPWAASSPGRPSVKPILLDGVTGSGKTEVYFHLMAQVLAAGVSAVGREGGASPLSTHGDDDAPRSAVREPRAAGVSAPWREGGASPPSNQILILLPEIALTHQWLARFEATFGAAPVVWHSRMTPAAKARAWQAVARGEVPIVVGARSALFLPFANLRLIIVDEEHDPSYKQEEGVLYHARDMAVARAQFEGVPILLASATPSLETLENVRNGKYRAFRLPERFGAAGLPTVKLVDLRRDTPERGDFIAPSVRAAMLETLARGEQVLFFMNRRGYAPLLLCRTCGHRFQCDDCSAWLVVHEKKAGGRALHCHHCNHREPMPTTCPACNAGGDMLAPCGPGVERIAQEVRSYFVSGSDEVSIVDEVSARRCAGRSQPRLAVLSSDEAVAAETWAAIEAGEVDIIVGTQMVAKGHHFPKLTLVVVVDADVGLDGADLRAGERSYQLLHQLAGRAGRGDHAGTVLVQTFNPQHAVMQALVAHDRDRLMALEAGERQRGNWPPFGQLAAILLDGVNEANVRAAGQMLARTAPDDTRLRVLGPAPAPLSRLRGQYRYRLLVKAEKTIRLQATLRHWLTGQKFPGVRIKVDVNPYYFM
ncbi:MAG: primosomal protein N' [Alphaproteobacteria bacterium]|nr:primosomal protein N' [Alphaproteobacteria bacterium]